MMTTDKMNLSNSEAGNGTADPPQYNGYPHPPYHQPATTYPVYPVYPSQSAVLAPPGQTLPYNFQQVFVLPFIQVREYVPKSLPMAVTLCIPILGLFGAHHFYLNNLTLGYLYAFTCGLFGIGWVVDWFRIKGLVDRCNEEIHEAREKGHWVYGIHRFLGPLRKTSLVDAYLMWLPPFGCFGFHHFYLGRTRYGLFSVASCGLNAVGWVIDLFRMPLLVRQANHAIDKMKRGITVDEPRYLLADAYLLAIPLGIFGLHHFYLGNARRGVLYLCTLGVFGLGWLADLFQMPCIVNEARKQKELQMRLTTAQQGITTNTVVVHQSPGWTVPEPPPAYQADAKE